MKKRIFSIISIFALLIMIIGKSFTHVYGIEGIDMEKKNF